MNRCHPPLPANRKTGALAWLLGLLFLAAGSLPAQVTYTWNSGDILTGGITPAGVTTITTVDTLNIVTGNDHDFNGRLVTNNGTVSWQAGRIRSGSGGAFTNNATWNDTSDTYAFNNDYGGAGTTFINAAGGTYNKLSGATYFDTTFANAGTINVSGGTLSFRAGGTFTNGSVVGSSGPGVVQLTSGTLTMTGNITATNFLFNGGTLAGDQTFTGSVLNWQNGVWNSANTTTIASNSKRRASLCGLGAYI